IESVRRGWRACSPTKRVGTPRDVEARAPWRASKDPANPIRFQTSDGIVGRARNLFKPCSNDMAGAPRVSRGLRKNVIAPIRKRHVKQNHFLNSSVRREVAHAVITRFVTYRF